MLGLQKAKISLAFYMGAGDLNLLSHVCRRGALTELSLQPKVEIFLWFSHEGLLRKNIKNDKYTVDRKLKFSCLPWNETDFEEF